MSLIQHYRRSTCALPMMAALLLWPAVLLAAPESIRTVAIAGDSAPGMGADAVFNGLQDVVINDLRQTAFVGNTVSVDGTGMGVFFAEPDGLPELVAKAGAPAPGTQTPANFGAHFPWVGIADDGGVIFMADLEKGPGDPTVSGIWWWNGSKVTILALEGQLGGGPGLGTFIDGFEAAWLAATTGGRVAFIAAGWSTTDVDGCTGNALWAGDSDFIGPIVCEYQPAPGAGGLLFDHPLGGEFSETLTGGLLTEAGSTATNASVKDDWLPIFGIWRGGTDEQTSAVMINGWQMPGPEAGSCYNGLHNWGPSINANGTLAWMTQIGCCDNDDPCTITGSAVLFGKPGGPTTVLPGQSTPVVGLPGGLTTHFGVPLINGKDEVVFFAGLEGPGVDDSNGSALLVTHEGVPHVVVRQGDPAPGLPDAILGFGYYVDYATNAQGQVAMESSLTDSAGGALGQGIFLTDELGSLKAVAGTGLPLSPSGGGGLGVLTPTSVDMIGNSGGQDGRRRALNNTGDLAFKAQFDNGTYGLFVAQPFEDCNGNGNPDEAGEADGDGDGRIDDCDNCPAEKNADQTDSDSDGAGDACDDCPLDPDKTEPGACGCNMEETDTDQDGTPDCNDGCPDDKDKVAPGECGCKEPETDSDKDGTPDCVDICPDHDDTIDTDADGVPDGCDICPGGDDALDSDQDGVPDFCDDCPGEDDGVDTDKDGTPDCIDQCPLDGTKTLPGVCGCGVPDTDSDIDGTPDCVDGCPNDNWKTAPGQCGCGNDDLDSDGDGIADCNDGCPQDILKTEPETCGCGEPETDSDSDGFPDCIDDCPTDPLKDEPLYCGCGEPETDSDGDDTPDCADDCPHDPALAGDNDSDGDGVLDCNDACRFDKDKVKPGACGCGIPDEDIDGDGAPDCPGAGTLPQDGNNDGVADDEQPHVSSIITPAGTALTLVAPEGTTVTDLHLADPPPADQLPSDVAMPLGWIGFSIGDLPAPGATVVVEIIDHRTEGPDLAGYWKHGPTPENPSEHTYDFAFDGQTGAQVQDHSILITFIDGARGDADLAANGVIVDPGALVEAAGDDSSGGGGCTMSRVPNPLPVPFLVLIVLLGLWRRSVSRPHA